MKFQRSPSQLQPSTASAAFQASTTSQRHNHTTASDLPMSAPSRRSAPDALRHPASSKYAPRYDLRRRVLVTNLMRGHREGSLTSIVDQSPDRPAKRWGYSESKRLLTFQPALTRRRIKSPRKLGSPRPTETAAETIEAQQRRLRRSGSYREAVSADAAVSAAPAEDLPKAKKARVEVSTGTGPSKASAVTNLGHPSNETHRVQHGQPFVARPCFEQTSVRSAMKASTSKAHLPAASTPVRRQARVTVRRCVPVTHPGLENIPPAALQVPTIVQSRQALLSQDIQPYVNQLHAPSSLVFRGIQSSLQPLHPNSVPESPRKVTQSTQTSPPPKSKGLLRRRSSLRRALERVLGVGKENEQTAKRVSGNSSLKDNSLKQSSRVKRRPSFVEAFLSRRRSCDAGSSDCSPLKRPAQRRSTGLPGFRSTEDYPKSMPDPVVKIRRARSLRVQSSTFDPWG